MKSKRNEETENETAKTLTRCHMLQETTTMVQKLCFHALALVQLGFNSRSIIHHNTTV